MAYIKGEDRHQKVLFPDCVEDYVEKDAPVRLFDAFVDSLDMESLGFIRSTPNQLGTPGYDPRDLLKLYLYGYFYQVRSSRRLARECICNVEVMWLLSKLTPDFRTISDFRKDNRAAIHKVFKEFNRFCMDMKILSRSYIAIDGSKFKAVNAKDRNFTLSKLDDRIKRLNEHIVVYMRDLDSLDDEEDSELSREDVKRKLDECVERKGRYEGYREHLEATGGSQLSLSDCDARLMKQNEGFGVCYNVQTAVDAQSHMIAGFKVTNSPTDHGQLTALAKEVKDSYGGEEPLECTADKGYESSSDISFCLANGIIPNVIKRDGGDSQEVAYEYKPCDISDEVKSSTAKEDIQKCLKAGVVPDVYEGRLEKAEVQDVCKTVSAISDSDVASMTEGQMRQRALEGYFVRDAGRNLVYCPQGQILRQKALKRNGNIRYCNRLACKRCKNKCTSAKFKEVDFDKDKLVVRAKLQNKRHGDGSTPRTHTSTPLKSKVVRYILHLDKEKMDKRKCLSEHPFGTIKRALGQYYFLLKGIAKVEAEMSLFCLSYNMRRAINIAGVIPLVAMLKR